MAADHQQMQTDAEEQAPQPKRAFEDLPAPAQRALREAEERRAKSASATANLPKEINGRGGEDPARYGDWEVKGIAIDF